MSESGNWNRREWFAAVEEFTAAGLQGTSKECMRQVDEWSRRLMPPSELWGRFVECLRHTQRDPIRPSAWRALRAILESLRGAGRGVDEEGLVKAIERLGFCRGNSILGLDTDSEDDIDDFLAVARKCFEIVRVRELGRATLLCEDASETLRAWGCEDAASELKRWGEVSDIHWNELSDREQQILWVLGEKGVLQREAIEKEFVGRSGQRGEAGASKNQLAELVKKGILRSKRGAGYSVKQWPSGYPRAARRS